MECQFCKNTYSNQYILKTHQQTTKKCILLQNQGTNHVVNNEIKFQCSYCHKILSSKARLDTHYSTCKSKIKKDSETLATKKIVEEKQDELEEVAFKLRSEKEQIEYELRKAIQEKDAKIKELEFKLEYHEKHPRIKNKTNNITNNNYIQNIYEVMTPERVEEYFKKHYNIETLMQGVPGIARFLTDNFIGKSSYICSDRSRHKFIMTDKDGNSMEDTNCKNLLSLTAPGMKHVKDVYETSIFDRHEEFTEEEIHDTYQPISVLHKDPSPLKIELSKIVPETSSSKVEDESWKKEYESLEESYKKHYDKTLKKSKEKETSVEPETVTEPVLQTIAGISLGTLQKYKIGYQDRKRKSNGVDVEIKGPESFMKLYHTDPVIKKQYDEFITS